MIAFQASHSSPIGFAEFRVARAPDQDRFPIGAFVIPSAYRMLFACALWSLPESGIWMMREDTPSYFAGVAPLAQAKTQFVSHRN
jgi:hypothetical protein